MYFQYMLRLLVKVLVEDKKKGTAYYISIFLVNNVRDRKALSYNV